MEMPKVETIPSKAFESTPHTKLRIFVLGKKDAAYLHQSGINEGTYLARYEKAKLDSAGRVRLTLVLDPTSVEDRVARRVAEQAEADASYAAFDPACPKCGSANKVGHACVTEPEPASFVGSTVTGLHADAVAVPKQVDALAAEIAAHPCSTCGDVGCTVRDTGTICNAWVPIVPEGGTPSDGGN